MADVFKGVVDWLLASNIPPASIILFIIGFFLLVLGISTDGFSIAGITCPAPNDSYRGIAILLGSTAIVAGVFLALKSKNEKRANSLKSNSCSWPRKTAKELEQEVMMFMMDIFESKFDLELQAIADCAIIEHKKQRFSLATCFLYCLRKSTYLGENLQQTSIFQLSHTEERSLFVADSYPILPARTEMALIQDSGLFHSDRPKGHASMAFIEKKKIKIYFDNSIPFLLEEVGVQGANEKIEDYIVLPAILDIGKLGSSVAIPIPHHKDYTNHIGVLCISGNTRDQFAGKENDHKLDQVARLVSVIMEIQFFFNDLSSLSAEL